MPAISTRGSHAPASPIRKLVPYAEKAIREGKEIFFLNIGQPDLPTPQCMLDAVRNLRISVLEYSHSAGFESYRRHLSQYYRQHQIHVTPEDILITTGGSEAILFTFLACLDPGDEIIIPEPFYANYNGFAGACGVKVKTVTSHIENGFALPPAETFEKLISPDTRAILICNPNNPTGYLYKLEELLALKELALQYDLFLIADEVYREFVYDGRKHHSVLQLEGLDDHAILIDSISKRYSACGARIGALVTRNRAVIDTALKYAQARLSPPTLAQILAEASLDVPPSYFKAVVEEYRTRRDLLVKGLQKIPGVVCPNPGGAFYVTVQLPVDDAEKFCIWLLEYFDHNGQTVMLAPASGFYATAGAGKQQVRIAYVLEKEKLERAVACLEQALKVYPGRIPVKNNVSSVMNSDL